MADRNLFGGTPADVAENDAGVRVPGAVGLVWDSKEDTAAQVTDLVDINGTPIVQLVADERGVIPLFWGPADGREALWVDFGVGRMKLTSNSVGERFKSHLEQLDPHNSKAYTDDRLTDYIPRRGARINCEKGTTWTGFKVPDVVNYVGDTAGNVFKLETEGKSPAGHQEFTRIKNSGALYVDPVGSHVPVHIGQYEGVSDNGTAVAVSRGRAGTDPVVFRVRADGRVEANGAVSAPNIGGARLFSGPTAPANPRIGDVWVEYGA
ncbi:MULTISPECIES: hypothetical protein [Streptomyces]|uniref:hypothetical protein n=1 Tax=Streptomyces TaxID=1883 RepID=UPI001E623374|nr:MULTISPECIES: hypothetical protein [Streptomyces]UFQ16419.1 hypothetical protein J2N69_16200 [Streptomyces huasconensis]WCL86022.1 hypothetical protein PPN52_16205 [Streptomyces sp. JCM 35825]